MELTSLLRCPYCLEKIILSKKGALCNHCGEEFYYNQYGQLDFRLRKLKKISLSFELLTESDLGHEKNLGIVKDVNPDLTKKFKSIPERLSREMISHFPLFQHKQLFVLDIGCGETIHKELFENLGYTYVGTDVTNSPDSSFSSDAHALPLGDDIFDLVVAINVFEHLRYPFAAIKEIERVLKQGGTFIGVVSFLEPYHMNSYYHFTLLGTYNMLTYADLEVELISPSPNWDVFKALSSMGFIPKAPKFLIYTLFLPVRIFYNIWWKIGSVIDSANSKRSIKRMSNKAGSFLFIAKKNL